MLQRVQVVRLQTRPQSSVFLPAQSTGYPCKLRRWSEDPESPEECCFVYVNTWEGVHRTGQPRRETVLCRRIAWIPILPEPCPVILGKLLSSLNICLFTVHSRRLITVPTYKRHVSVCETPLSKCSAYWQVLCVYPVFSRGQWPK